MDKLSLKRYASWHASMDLIMKTIYTLSARLLSGGDKKLTLPNGRVYVVDRDNKNVTRFHGSVEIEGVYYFINWEN